MKTRKVKYLAGVRKAVQSALEKESKQSIAHGIDHFDRVRINALKIAKHYPETDLEILQIASLLHDINQPIGGKMHHIEKSVKTAELILNQLPYPKKKEVLEIIGQHSTEKLAKKTSIEARILFDADKLDGLGYLGIARTFIYCGQNGMTLKQTVRWYEKKIDIAISNLETQYGKKIAKPKLSITKHFLKKLKQEL